MAAFIFWKDLHNRRSTAYLQRTGWGDPTSNPRSLCRSRCHATTITERSPALGGDWRTPQLNDQERL